MNKIIISFNGRVVQEVPFDGSEVRIGRGVGNDVKIDNPAVSSNHARIFREKDCFYIEDSGSTNGTYLNGEKISRAIINSKDDILVGKHQLKLGWEQGTGEYSEAGDSGQNGKVIASLDKTMMISSSASSKGKGSGEPTGGFFIMDGSVSGEKFEMKDRVTTIGKSSDSLIRLKGLMAPKVAALVNRSAKGYIISSPDSRKSPVINGKTLDKPYTLKNGDIVEVGGIQLRFYLKK